MINPQYAVRRTYAAIGTRRASLHRGGHEYFTPLGLEQPSTVFFVGALDTTTTRG
ncbi:MAG: hypothetical protein WKH64_10105 [Chloroflexia bacterium]